MSQSSMSGPDRELPFAGRVALITGQPAGKVAVTQ